MKHVVLFPYLGLELHDMLGGLIFFFHCSFYHLFALEIFVIELLVPNHVLVYLIEGHERLIIVILDHWFDAWLLLDAPLFVYTLVFSESKALD